MKKRKIYLFNNASRAAVYGIGTYLENLIHCLRQSHIEFEMVYLHAEGKEVSVQQRQGYRQISIPSVPNSNTPSSEYYSRNVAYLLREFIPDDPEYTYLFHLNFMTDPHLVSYLKKMFPSKVVLTVHYTNWSFSLMGDFERLKKIMATRRSTLTTFEKHCVDSVRKDEKLIKKCDRCVFIAQHSLTTCLQSTKIDKAKTIVVNNGLRDTYRQKSEAQLNRIRHKYNIGQDTKIILFAGRLDPVKGVSFLINSYKKVHQSHPDTLLIVAGEGNFEGLYKEAKHYWTRIIFTGRLEKKELYEFYHLADVGVVCSLHEEFGYVAIEMMMHRLPVIATQVGGLDEIIQDGVCGLKVPVRMKKGERVVDTNRLSSSINLLLENSALAARIGDAGRKRFLDKYEVRVFKKNILSVYNDL